ncbi:MAG: U32 family peptidase [Candidatus Gastranaerophilaceae bacterium]
MKNIELIAPVKKPEDIEIFANYTSCRKFYVYHKKFMENNFDYISKFVEVAKKNCSQIFINFKHNISEKDLDTVQKMIKYLKTTGIDGIFVNSYAVLEAIKIYSLPFRVIIDSYFDIHNLSGIDFMNNFHKIDAVIITEEVYLKNIAKIKKYTKLPLAIDTDNLPWFAEDIVKSNAINSVVIKGKFGTSEDILDGITLVEKIIENPKVYKNQKLPFKHVRKSIYQTNHFSGDVVSAQGQDFKFSRNIINFDWTCHRTKLSSSKKYFKEEGYAVNLRLSELAHINALEKFIKKVGFNPVDSIEYGEILSTADLAKSSFEEVIKKVKAFCKKYNISFQLSTPRILIERDFDRVYEYCKALLLEEPVATSLIINNIGYFWSVINDNDLARIPIEIGQGVNLLNSVSIECLNNLHTIDTVDFTLQTDLAELFNTIKRIKSFIKNRKMTIAGNLRVPSLGLCPLNSDSAVVSRLSCKAPCHRGGFALHDPALDKAFPFTCDGFCRMHMFEDSITEKFDCMDEYINAGINEFVFDFSALNYKFLPILLTNYLNSRCVANSK